VIRGRRDRHGRGLRGPLGPAHLPIVRSRSAVFGASVLDAVDFVEERLVAIESTSATGLVAAFDAVDIVVDDVGPADDRDDTSVESALGSSVALGRAEPADDRRPVRLVVHRRPIEHRSRDPRERDRLVRDVVVRLAAEILALDPRDLDPEYDAPD